MGTRFVAQSMWSFTPVDAEGTPPHPRGTIESCRLRNLARVKDLQQRGIHDHGLRISHQLGQHDASQGFEESPELAHAAVQRGGVEADDSREEMGEEASSLAQEGAFGFHPSKLLEERESEDL